MWHETFNAILNFISMRDGLAFDDNFAQRVHSADNLFFCNAFIRYMHSWDPKKKWGARDLLLAPSTEVSFIFAINVEN